jgi:hypothetical protein
MRKLLICVMALIAFTFCFVLKAHAGAIVDAGLPDSVEELIRFTEIENNDNVEFTFEDLINSEEPPEDFNWVLLVKEFDSLEPIDIPFLVEDSGGVTEYLFIEGIINATEEDWLDFHLEIGVEMDEEFVKMSEFDSQNYGLDFDTPDNDPTPAFFRIIEGGEGEDDTVDPVFNSVDHLQDQLAFYNGVLPPLDELNDVEDLPFVAFSIDVPDVPEEYREELEDSYEFILRQYPTLDGEGLDVDEVDPIPEPGTMFLLGFGLLGFAGMRRKK